MTAATQERRASSQSNNNEWNAPEINRQCTVEKTTNVKQRNAANAPKQGHQAPPQLKLSTDESPKRTPARIDPFMNPRALPLKFTVTSGEVQQP